MGSFAFLLYPFAVFYDGITTLRNWCFDQGVFRTTPSSIPGLLVGNLRVGGTGKTPMVEYLIKMLAESYSIATLSRGYGRKTRGYLQASVDSRPQEIGDEPFQIFQKFGKSISVHVCENRVEGVAKIKASLPETNLVILDDAFQHRSISLNISVVLTTFDDPFTSDFLLPMGRLRESRAGAARADVIVVTKCPETLSHEERNSLSRKIDKYTLNGTPVLFSWLGYGSPYLLEGNFFWNKDVILVSGIADDRTLEAHVSKRYHLVEKISFGDHHDFTSDDMESILKLWQKHEKLNPVILVTEKDAEKVKSFVREGFLAEIPIFVQPIQIQFSPEDEAILRDLIAQKVN